VFTNLKLLDLAPNRGSPRIIKVIDTNLDAVAFVWFFGKAICKRRINQNTRMVVEWVVLGAQIIHQLRTLDVPLMGRGACDRVAKQGCWYIDIAIAPFGRLLTWGWAKRLRLNPARPSSPLGQDAPIFDRWAVHWAECVGSNPERIAKLDDQNPFANLATSKKRKDSSAAAREIEEGGKLQTAIRRWKA